HLVGADRSLAGGSRRGAGSFAQGRRDGNPASRDRPLVDRERHAGGAPASPRPHRPALRNRSSLGSPLRPARLPSAGLARPRGIAKGLLIALPVAAPGPSRLPKMCLKSEPYGSP